VTAYAAFVLGILAVAFWRHWLVAAGCLAAVLVATVYTAGHPRPRAFGVPETITVWSAQFVPDEGIYLWSLADPPVAYALPWTDEAAMQLQEAMREAEETGLMGTAIQLDWGGYGGVQVDVIEPVPGVKVDE